MKVSVYIATSLDGFIARENGDLDWLPGAQEGSNGDVERGAEDYGYHEFIDSIDVLVMGRNTFEKVMSFGQWPYGNKRVVVLTNRPVHIPSNLIENVEPKSCSPSELINELSESGAQHLYIDGGNTIQAFLDAGLIQEITLTKLPILIGSGIPLFGLLSKDIHLAHIETRSFEGGFVQSRYRVID